MKKIVPFWMIMAFAMIALLFAPERMAQAQAMEPLAEMAAAIRSPTAAALPLRVITEARRRILVDIRPQRAHLIRIRNQQRASGELTAYETTRHALAVLECTHACMHIDEQRWCIDHFANEWVERDATRPCSTDTLTCTRCEANEDANDNCAQRDVQAVSAYLCEDLKLRYELGQDIQHPLPTAPRAAHIPPRVVPGIPSAPTPVAPQTVAPVKIEPSAHVLHRARLHLRRPAAHPRQDSHHVTHPSTTTTPRSIPEGCSEPRRGSGSRAGYWFMTCKVPHGHRVSQRLASYAAPARSSLTDTILPRTIRFAHRTDRGRWTALLNVNRQDGCRPFIIACNRSTPSGTLHPNHAVARLGVCADANHSTEEVTITSFINSHHNECGDNPVIQFWAVGGDHVVIPLGTTPPASFTPDPEAPTDSAFNHYHISTGARRRGTPDAVATRSVSSPHRRDHFTKTMTATRTHARPSYA